MTAPTAPSNVKMPAAVRQAAEAANRMIADLNAPPGANPAPATIPAAPSAAQPGSAGSPPAPHPAAAAAPPQPSAEEQLRVVQARYQTLQGKYNAETAALRGQVEENSMLVRDLLARSAAAAVQPAQVPANQSPEDYLKSLGATDADIKDYGELLPILVRLAQNMYRPTIQKLENELNAIRNQTAQTATATVEERKQRIWDELDDKVPAWRVINESDHFLDWLRIVDIFSGVTRHVALASAFKTLDRARVVGIFEAYAREYPEAARTPGAPAVDPATLVAPEVRGGQAPAAPEGGAKKIFSESEIRNFYTRVRKKLVSADEYARFQEEIAAATAEGRIRPDRPDHHANR
jgi:hypothetical protein